MDLASTTLFCSISIHALREEGDEQVLVGESLPMKFLSTPSVRRATAKTENYFAAFVPLYTNLNNFERVFLRRGTKKTILRFGIGILWCEASGNFVRACSSHRGAEDFHRISTPSCSKAG